MIVKFPLEILICMWGVEEDNVLGNSENQSATCVGHVVNYDGCSVADISHQHHTLYLESQRDRGGGANSQGSNYGEKRK